MKMTATYSPFFPHIFKCVIHSSIIFVLLFLISISIFFFFFLFVFNSTHSTSDSANVLVCIPNNLTLGVFMDYIFSTLIQTEDAVLDMAALQEKLSSQAASQVLLVNIAMLV